MKTLMKSKKKPLLKKKSTLSKRTLRVFSRHPSHRILRRKAILTPVLACIRLGSTTVGTLPYKVEINSVESIRRSANKLFMKQAFERAGVKTAERWTDGALNDWARDRYPIVAKSHYGSRGDGNTLIMNQSQLESWMRNKNVNNYIFEKFYNYGLEFRLHITERGCFYTCRKALKQDCPESEKWRHHDDNCVWFMETNENFLKPNSWNDIVTDCCRALKSVGADVLSFDVKVQSATNQKGKRREYQDYILLECNSASSFGDVTAEKYIEEIPRIIDYKLRKL